MSSAIAATPDSIDAFRREVQAFLRANVTPALRERVLAGNYLQKDEYLAWQKALGARGWGAPNWPVEHGGAGWTAMQKYVFEDESARMGAPIPIYLRNGLHIVGPLIIRFGRDDQKARYLPKILHGHELWAQGFSEPEAGSDLAALRCAARREGNAYVVNGTKIWTSLAHLSAHCLLLVRTGSQGEKHSGITILLVDLRLPGITIRPINAIDGYHHLNQVTFDNVRVPLDCRLGEEGNAWKMINVGLEAERLFLADMGLCKQLLLRLRSTAAPMPRGDGMLSGQAWFGERLGRLEIRLNALDAMILRLIDAPERITSREASMLKLRGTELAQDISQLMSEAAGLHALPYHQEVLGHGWQGEPVGPAGVATLTPFFLFWRKATISGGTSEIQKNIIARSLFGVA
jgi:alkylation response protein AidB-like acyl-CoA dehydrogenase